MSFKTKVSVIVCCFNSGLLLEETLTHLSKQKTPHDYFFEIILVDNNSSDDTIGIAKNKWLELAVPIRLIIVNESEQGIAHARKAGVKESTAELILFCDDDNWLDENYLWIAYNFMKDNPRVGALGGQSKEMLEAPEPKWWQNEKQNYAVGKQKSESGDISQRGFLWGAGLVIRKIILSRLFLSGFESLLVGRKGINLNSGDDSEICKWVLLMDYKLWYLNELKFIHFISQNRLTKEYLNRLNQGHLSSQHILNLYNWFIRSGYYKKINEDTYLTKLKLFAIAILAFLRKDIYWREKLQVIFGSKVKIHRDFYNIYNVYKKIIKT